MSPTANVSIPKRSNKAVNGSGGAFVSISASQFDRYVEIQECPPENPPEGTTWDGTNFAPQGLQYTLPDDNFTQVYPLLPGAILTLGDRDNARNHSIGQPGWTQPDGSAKAATVLCKVRSATATASQVEIREWPSK